MKRVAVVLMLLCACAGRYMLVTASSALDCPTDQLKHKEDNEAHVITGCGKTAKCSRVWWSGPDEWSCEVQK